MDRSTAKCYGSDRIESVPQSHKPITLPNWTITLPPSVNLHSPIVLSFLYKYSRLIVLIYLTLLWSHLILNNCNGYFGDAWSENMRNYFGKHIKLPKRVKRHSIEMALQCQCQVWLLCSRKELFYIWINVYTCTYLYRALFQNMISDHGIAIATSIFGLALNAFKI